MQEQINAFTEDDFYNAAVFEWLEQIGTNFQRKIAEALLTKRAKELKIDGFKGLLSAYRKDNSALSRIMREENISEFEGQSLELYTGEWHGDENGIWKYGVNGNIVYACSHPVYPVRMLRSIDTGTIKVRLKFSRRFGDKNIQSIDVPLSRLSKASEIIALADYGVSVTSGERAQALVDYLRDVLDKNQDAIPEVCSVSRMGWNESGFSPYVGGVEFDSAGAFRGVYKSITKCGSFDTWLSEAREIRSYSICARIVLAASFASCLVEKLGCLPFFVHLWSMASGTGKTVAQMLGASVWANPAAGGPFFPTFKSTSVGIELMAGFLHSLPVFLDELQLARDRHGKINFNVYELASGTGKLRGNKSLGLDYIPQWSNCFITSGESPIVDENEGAGAMNRVIEIECTEENPAVLSGRKTANILKANYGHAGKIFVDNLCADGGVEMANNLYDTFFAQCVEDKATEKQAMAAAIILTADFLATMWIFQDDRCLSTKEIGKFLKSGDSVSLSERAYDILCGWVASNESRFRPTVDTGEHYGVVEDGVAMINRMVFDRACADFGLSPKSVLSGLKQKGVLILGTKGYTRTKRIDGIPTSCVWMQLPPDMDAQD